MMNVQRGLIEGRLSEFQRIERVYFIQPMDSTNFSKTYEGSLRLLEDWEAIFIWPMDTDKKFRASNSSTLKLLVNEKYMKKCLRGRFTYWQLVSHRSQWLHYLFGLRILRKTLENFERHLQIHNEQTVAQKNHSKNGILSNQKWILWTTVVKCINITKKNKLLREEV